MRKRKGNFNSYVPVGTWGGLLEMSEMELSKLIYKFLYIDPTQSLCLTFLNLEGNGSSVHCQVLVYAGFWANWLLYSKYF
jgi:hypothetical protein